MKTRPSLLTGIALLIVFVGAAALDWFADVSRFLAFRGAVVFAGMGVVATIAVAARQSPSWVSLLLFVVAVSALPWWDHSPVKPFARFYAATHMGMTRAEVRAELERHYAWSGRHAKPRIFSVQDGHLGYSITPPMRSDVMVVSLYFDDDDRVVYRSLHDD